MEKHGHNCHRQQHEDGKLEVPGRPVQPAFHSHQLHRFLTNTIIQAVSPHKFKRGFITILVLRPVFQDNMAKLVPECQTILDFAAARMRTRLWMGERTIPNTIPLPTKLVTSNGECFQNSRNIIAGWRRIFTRAIHAMRKRGLSCRNMSECHTPVYCV